MCIERIEFDWYIQHKKDIIFLTDFKTLLDFTSIKIKGENSRISYGTCLIVFNVIN